MKRQPIPATLPLFATGLGAMGLLGWRRKRKNTKRAAASAKTTFIAVIFLSAGSIQNAKAATISFAVSAQISQLVSTGDTSGFPDIVGGLSVGDVNSGLISYDLDQVDLSVSSDSGVYTSGPFSFVVNFPNAPPGLIDANFPNSQIEVAHRTSEIFIGDTFVIQGHDSTPSNPQFGDIVETSAQTFVLHNTTAAALTSDELPTELILSDWSIALIDIGYARFEYAGFNSPLVGQLEVRANIVSIEQISAVPLPASLPLFASGLGALSLLRWRTRRKKQSAAAQCASPLLA